MEFQKLLKINFEIQHDLHVSYYLIQQFYAVLTTLDVSNFCFLDNKTAKTRGLKKMLTFEGFAESKVTGKVCSQSYRQVKI